MATIDILMATYNGEQFVREQIESIQAQTFEDWRLLVSDDCSTDDTLNIVFDLAKNDRRIQVASKEVSYGSAKANFMHLSSLSNASYVMFCDQDDVWLNRKIELSFSRMKELERKNNDVPILVFSDMKVVNLNLEVINKSFMRYSHIDSNRNAFGQLLAQSIGAGCTLLINHKALEYASLLTNYESMIMHDWWFFLICSAFGMVSYINQPTSLYRQHGSNEVGAKAYQPLRKVLEINSMKASVADSVAQARLFFEIYGEMLSWRQQHTIKEFISSGEACGISAVIHLFKSGCWKKGLRKLGQIMVAFRGV